MEQSLSNVVRNKLGIRQIGDYIEVLEDMKYSSQTNETAEIIDECIDNLTLQRTELMKIVKLTENGI